jgi:hypothetical protein
MFNDYFKFFILIFHISLLYFIFISTLITNNIPTLLLLLILVCIIKCSFYFFDRCLLSVFEKNEVLNTVSVMSIFTKTDKLTEIEIEEIIINIGLLMLLNKIFFLLLLREKTL